MTRLKPLWAQLRGRKIVQWALAYLATAWLILQVLDVLAQPFAWPDLVLRAAAIGLGVGFFGALIVAWYHGERGTQRISTVELGMLTGILIIAAAAISQVRPERAAAPDIASLDRSPLSDSTADAAIAVLPFANLSDDRSNEYFADGITDDILTHLSRIPDLRVISRTSVMQYKNTTRRIPEIAAELGVRYVLEGSVRRDGMRVRITAQLIEAQVERHVWADLFDREVTSIFEIQSDIAQHIAHALRANLSPEDSARIARGATQSIAAYDLYLRGREYLLRPGSERSDIDAALALFRRALEQDSSYARAWAGVSIAVQRSVQPLSLKRDSALAHAERAVALDPTLTEARVAHAGALALAGRREQSELKFREAFTLDPNSAEAMSGIASILEQRGELVESLEWYARAMVADPTNANYHNSLGWVFLRMGALEEAIRSFRRHLVAVPDAPGSRANIAVIHLLTGDTVSAEAEIEHLPGDAPGRIHTLRSLGMYAIWRGDDEGARMSLQQHSVNSPQEAAWNALAYNAYRRGDETALEAFLHRAEAAGPVRAGTVNTYAWDVVGQQMYYEAEIGALRGDARTALRLLHSLYSRGWRDYWLVVDGFDHRLGTGMLVDVLRGQPEFDRLVANMRRELDRSRATLAARRTPDG